MTKLVFHLGDIKSGSTAIQSALASGGWSCPSVALVYPTSGQLSHILLARSLYGRIDGSRTELLFRDIREKIDASSADVAVISAEDFEFVDPDVLMEVMKTFLPDMLADARFLSYVRPHTDRIPSTFAEHVKIGVFGGTLTELQKRMHNNNRFYYTPRFLAWRRVFGDAFTLRPMIRDHLYRKDVVADFLRFALQTEDFEILASPDSNESLTVENLAILRFFQQSLLKAGIKNDTFRATFGRSLARRMNADDRQDGTKMRIHRSLAETVRAQYSADAATLDAAFFQDTPMSDALKNACEKAVDEEQSLQHSDYFNQREQYLIELFVGEIATLIGADPRGLANMLRLEHRNKVLMSQSLASSVEEE